MGDPIVALTQHGSCQVPAVVGAICGSCSCHDGLFYIFTAFPFRISCHLAHLLYLMFIGNCSSASIISLSRLSSSIDKVMIMVGGWSLIHEAINHGGERWYGIQTYHTINYEHVMKLQCHRMAMSNPTPVSYLAIKKCTYSTMSIKPTNLWYEPHTWAIPHGQGLTKESFGEWCWRRVQMWRMILSRQRSWWKNQKGNTIVVHINTSNSNNSSNGNNASLFNSSQLRQGRRDCEKNHQVVGEATLYHPVDK